MKKLLICCICLFSCSMILISKTYAQYSDNDILLERLEKKGLLSPVDVAIIKGQTREYVSKHMAEGHLMSLPEWVQRVELKGDVRLRYQYEKRKAFNNGRSITRGRLRARIGILTKLNKQLKTGVGITTSNDGDARSTNITFSDGFDRADLRLDYAYAEFTPTPWFKVIGGKFQRGDYLWTPTDLVWDSDINPEGASAHAEVNINRLNKIFFNTGSWVVDAVASTTKDQFLLYSQAGWNFDNDVFDSTLAGNFYYFRHLKGFQLDGTSCTNSGLTLLGNSCNGTLSLNYRDFGGSAEIGYRKMINEKFKRIAIFGDYIRNNQTSQNQSILVNPKENQGWAAGIKFGDMKISELWDWQAKYQYSYLERDAIPDILPNSDRYDGETNVEGHNFGIDVGLGKHAILGFDYFRDKPIQADSDQHQQLYQVDVQVKF